MGVLCVKVEVTVEKFAASAEQKIQAAGGTATATAQ
ncbi:uL15 family ribosomal protein [Rothia kristinae]